MNACGEQRGRKKQKGGRERRKTGRKEGRKKGRKKKRRREGGKVIQ